MKNQNPEQLNTQNTDAEPPTKPPGQEENQNEDIDYSSFDIDESTGGSAMEEFEDE